MSSTAITVLSSNDEIMSEPEPGLRRQVMSYNKGMMLVRHKMTKGWAGARHSHPHHQMVYLVSGHIRFEAEGKSWEMRAGDSIVVDGGVEHEASAIEASEVLDVFTPYREEYA